MPSIEVAMERSLRRGFPDMVVAALRPALQRRDVITNAQGQITNVKTAFSSWGNCMQASFCKWPVIAIIIIGGLILFSILWCIGRCLFCGLSCCCECCYCLKCCGECCGCCSPPGHKRHKHLDDPYVPPNQGYRSEAPMHSGPVSSGAGGGSFKSEPPQYAEFDSGRKGDNDSLPAMPSWESSGSKKVLVEEEALEMDQLKKPENTGPTVPLLNGATSPTAPASPSPYGRGSPSPYGPPTVPPTGPLPGRPGAQSPYGMNRPGYNQTAGPYGQSNSSFGADQGYGMGVGAIGTDRRSPRPFNEGYSQGSMDSGYRGTPGPQGYNNGYGRSTPGAPASRGMDQGYGMGPQGLRSPPSGSNMRGYPEGARQSPGSQADYGRRGPGAPGMPGPGFSDGARRSPAPPNMPGATYAEGSRSSPAPQGDYGYGGYNNRSPPPQRQFAQSPRPLAGPTQHSYTSPAPASPTSLQNTAGFDFNSGFSRPPTRDQAEAPPRPSTASARQEAGDAYPGYKAYQPSNPPRRAEEWTGV